jgi:hypothetical protein
VRTNSPTRHEVDLQTRKGALSALNDWSYHSEVRFTGVVSRLCLAAISSRFSEITVLPTFVTENGVRFVIVSLHRELGRGTLGAILRQCGVTASEFIELL